MQKNVLCIKNGDARQSYLAGMMSEQGYAVDTCDICCPDAGDYDIVLLPMFSRKLDLEGIGRQLRMGQKVFGGMFPAFFEEVCMQKGVCCYDYMEEEAIAVRNASAAAEGAIAEAICLSDETLHGSSSLIIGFGRCGRILADRLNGMHSRVAVLEQNREKRAQAQAYGFDVPDVLRIERYSYVFNTVPAPVLGREQLLGIKEGAVIIDIASGKGGVDHGYCREKGIRERHCLSLPGRYAPKSAAEILYEYVEKLCRQEET